MRERKSAKKSLIDKQMKPYMDKRTQSFIERERQRQTENGKEFSRAPTEKI